MMKVAICTDIAEFQENRLLDKNWCRRFPGASWMPVFGELMQKQGVSVVSGDMALSSVKKGYWNAEDIVVIQEMNAFHGKKLAHLGAKSFIITCLESPLFAYYFYDQLPEIASKFSHRIFFSGAFQLFNSRSGYNHHLYFPSYDSEQIGPLMPWDEREFLVMVAANKYWNESVMFPLFTDPRAYVGFLLDIMHKFRSPTRRKVKKNQNHDKRLDAIKYFGSLNRIAIFGHGWHKTQGLPSKWRKSIEPILHELDPQPCDNKLRTISGFKFALCLENVSFPGYITEKIIDCFVAGVIPIYMGAPDVKDFIPNKSFIDLRDFDSWNKLESYLNEIDERNASEIISEGRNFLKSPIGKLHSDKGFAKFILDLILTKGQRK